MKLYCDWKLGKMRIMKDSIQVLPFHFLLLQSHIEYWELSKPRITLNSVKISVCSSKTIYAKFAKPLVTSKSKHATLLASSNRSRNLDDHLGIPSRVCMNDSEFTSNLESPLMVNKVDQCPETSIHVIVIRIIFTDEPFNAYSPNWTAELRCRYHRISLQNYKFQSVKKCNPLVCGFGAMKWDFFLSASCSIMQCYT